MLELRDIDRDNFEAVVALKPAEGQEHFVRSNAGSIAEAKVCPECNPMAVYLSDKHGEQLVGFLMYCLDKDEDEYCMARLMIDAHYQRRGYGRAAVQALLDILKSDPHHRCLYVCVDAENTAARRLYEGCGFVDTGCVEDNEMVYRLDYEPLP